MASNRERFKEIIQSEYQGMNEPMGLSAAQGSVPSHLTEQIEPPRVNINPYDPSHESELGYNYIDVHCPCVETIRRSKCDMVFQSFANCHNVVIYNLYRRKNPPMFHQCTGQYKRLMLCLEKNGLRKTKLIDDPETRSTKPLGSTFDDLLQKSDSKQSSQPTSTIAGAVDGANVSSKSLSSSMPPLHPTPSMPSANTIPKASLPPHETSP